MFILIISSLNHQLNQDTQDIKQNQENKYSIAIISQVFRGGGLERVTQLLATKLSSDFKVYLITGPAQEDDYTVPQNVIRLEAYSALDWMREPEPTSQHSDQMEEKNIKLLSYAQKYNIKLFICQEHWAHGHYSTINFLKDNNIKVVAIEHNFYLFPIHDNREFLYKLSQQTYPRLDALICLSRVDVQIWRHIGVKNAIYFPNLLTFDPSTIQQAPLTSQNIIMVGRFHPGQKQQHLAIEMMKYVVPNVNASLQIIGDSTPDYFKYCQKVTNSLQLYYNVRFFPFQANIADFYRNASVLVMTSKTEGFPMVLIEAMAFGIPIVAFDLKFNELWTDNEGLIAVPQGDMEQMGAEVVKLMKNLELRKEIGAKGRESLNRFKNEVTVDKWIYLLKGLVNEENVIEEIKKSEDKVEWEYAKEVLNHELKLIGREGYDFGIEM
ncbi:Glycosyl_transferases group [Hexamita inflata]|uniref:Glycosyl transferases group n=1 Tax=Hexamita inflata TaxID=28002 RepID=A0AA86REU4_9EUKA|nr:Glycosyl transferases group [Hexamita inflata]